MPVLLRKIIPCFPNRKLILNSLYSHAFETFTLSFNGIWSFVSTKRNACCLQVDLKNNRIVALLAREQRNVFVLLGLGPEEIPPPRSMQQVYINSTPLTSWLFSSSKLKSLDAFATGNAHTTNFDVHVRLAYSLLGRLTSGCCPTLPCKQPVTWTRRRKKHRYHPPSHPNEQALGWSTSAGF